MGDEPSVPEAVEPNDPKEPSAVDMTPDEIHAELRALREHMALPEYRTDLNVESET